MEFVVHLSEENIKALKGETDGESGGGDTEQWETLFEGEVDTVLRNPNFAQGQTVVSEVIGANEIKVTFNDVDYTCNKRIIQGITAYGGIGENGPDFSEYPFAIMSGEIDGQTLMQVYTETAGTYSLKIEAQEGGESGGESGGDSDFTIAKVMVTNTKIGNIIHGAFYSDGSGELPEATVPSIGEVLNKFCDLILYKGKAIITADYPFENITGAIEQIDDAMYLVTGMCSVSILGGGSA